MAGGVQSLRAMFEQNSNNTIPHGRSSEENPAGMVKLHQPEISIINLLDGGEEPPKPLSKVRTSFVAVEGCGLLGSKSGPRRDVSGESSISQRSYNSQQNAKPIDLATRKDATPKNTSIAPVKQVVRKQEHDEHNLKIKTAVKANPATIQSMMPSGQTNKTIHAAVKQTSKPTSGISPNRATNKSSHPQKHLSSTSLTPAAKQTEFKRIEIKTRHGTISSARPKSSNGKPLPSSPRAATKTKSQTLPPQPRSQKPHPKSPTRPVKLPASLTTHTASSSSKFAAASLITKPQSRLLPGKSIGSNRPASQMSSASRAPSSLKDETSRSSSARRISVELKRRSSTQALTSQAAPAEDKFLARMMRPTTSFTFKAAEKSSSPSRQSRSVSRPRTQNGLMDAPSKQEMKKSPLGARKAKKEANASSNEIKINPLRPKHGDASKAIELPKFKKSEEVSELRTAKDIETAELYQENNSLAVNEPVPESMTPKDEAIPSADVAETHHTANDDTVEPLTLEVKTDDLRPPSSSSEQNNIPLELSALQITSNVKEVAESEALEINKTAFEIDTDINSPDKIEEMNKETKILIQEPDEMSEQLAEEKIVESTLEEVQTEQDQAIEHKSGLSKIETIEVLIQKEKTDSLYSTETSPVGLAPSEHTENRSSSAASPVSPVFQGFTEPPPKTSLLIPSASHFDTCRSPFAIDSALFEDPEDIKARDEIALLNAELMKAAYSTK
ncbi:hypothetical protein K3495_g3537 [Podosphaera aphanis]|nr:hypothetical protein K3495_g3537 [Podosphaera aphanis]